MTAVQLIRAPSLSSDVPYAHASVSHQASRLVHTSGACPIDEDGATVAVGDVAGGRSR